MKNVEQMTERMRILSEHECETEGFKFLCNKITQAWVKVRVREPFFNLNCVCVCLVVCACVWLCVCTVFIRFQAVSGSDVIASADDAEVLQTLTSDLRSCLHGNSLSDVSVIFCVARLLLIYSLL